MMTESELLDLAWTYPLFEALYGRRSRRFGLGFEMPEGPFRYKSAHTPTERRTRRTWRPGTPEFGAAMIEGATQFVCCAAYVGLWHECDIARSQMDVRFRGKNGRAAEITGTTEFGPICDMGGSRLSQRKSIVRSFAKA
jgi:hypothetical protein